VARETGLSRQPIHDLRQEATDAVTAAFEGSEPGLNGICLDTGYLYMTEVCPRRSGAEWGEVLSLGNLTD